ncbi:C-type mannose receptor 2-like [Pomacea canaliculata]|uniref:C-type mannose receptor 2-like n=1 Tax=Pomacea canaliculata TaxID=400727 RepID=UPI000D734EF4|nr:C-type mannose receptor 2-like [Pomacea canaliculata]
MLRLVVIVAASVILFFSGVDAARVTEPCDYGWSPFNSACYHIFMERMNWSAASSSCQEKDADLLFLNPSDSVKMLYINQQTESVIKQMTWWVTFEMKSLEGTLVSIPVNSSSTGHISLWKPNYPSNQDNYDCALMDPDGLLYDASCSSSNFFICEKHLDNSNKMKECESGWIPVASSCYKLSTVQRNWFGALRICSAYDADLMSVNSVQELLQIKKEIGLERTASRWWVGLQKMPWQWLKEPSPYKMFIPWEIGEPNDVKGNGNCVELTLGGLLNDASCDTSVRYICEKSMNKENCSTESAGMSSCYTVSTKKTNYREAKANCLADGANLLSIGSAKELLQVRKEMKRRERESHWWVGLRKNMSSNNTWKWLEEPPSLTPLVILWDVNQPDNTRNMENCAEMLTSGFMNDVDCFNNRPYICEKTYQ